MQLRRIPTVPAIALVAGVYLLIGKLSLHLAFLQANASPVWPPVAVALAALLVIGFRVWPAIFIGAFLANATTAGTIATSLGIAVGNTLEGLCAASLVVRFAGGTGAFNRYQTVFGFAAAVLISTIVSPTIGVTSLALGGFVVWPDYLPVWLTWWLGDFSSAMIFTPVLVLWMEKPRRRFDLVHDREVAVLLIALVVLSAVVFAGWSNLSKVNYPVAFVLGPIIVWTAFRLS
jgi:integral membrane sensor domain MASE1